MVNEKVVFITGAGLPAESDLKLVNILPKTGRRLFYLISIRKDLMKQLRN
jgi:hypothetical protein